MSIKINAYKVIELAVDNGVENGWTEHISIQIIQKTRNLLERVFGKKL